MATIGVIIVAGGVGKRMGGTLPKQFLILGGEPILARSINTIHEALPAAEIVVVMAEQYVELWRNIAARFDVARHKIAIGGKERFHSVKSGLAALSENIRTIAVHDAVRPLASKKMIIRLIMEAEHHTAVIPVVAPVDSFRIVEGEQSHIINRSQLRMVQTPQIFAAEALRQAYEQEFSEHFTDDASVMEAAGHTIWLAEGEQQNIKITTPEDMIFAEAVISSREQAEH